MSTTILEPASTDITVLSSTTSIELRSRNPEAPPAPPISTSTTLESPHFKIKLTSSILSFFVAGINDGSLGALLPYILTTYHISPSSISLLYLSTFLGWFLCALTNPYLTIHYPLGTLLLVGAVLQLIPHFLRFWEPPFALYVITFGLSGLGQAYQDSHANTYVASVQGGAQGKAHRWLGAIHAMYGLGLLVSPFVATSVATNTEGSKWMLFYWFPLGLSILNLVAVLAAFRESIGLKGAESENDGDEREGRKKDVMEEVRWMAKSKDLWIFCLFFFFHLGVCMTSAGWIVEFLVQVRGGELSKVGYVPSGAYGGVFLGRILLAEPTHRYGERKMLMLYSFICFALQMVFWLVPNLISSIMMFSIMGFFLGPFWAAGVSVASSIFPKHRQASSLGMIFVVAQAGGAVFPSLIGLIASKAGVKVLPPIVAGLVVAMTVTWAFVPKALTHRE